MKYKILQVNTTCGGSTGRIALQLDSYIRSKGYESIIAYGYGDCSSPNSYKISNMIDIRIHNQLSSITCLQGYFSIISTIKFIKYIEKVKPSLIHIHNIHGNYLNFKIFFNYLKKINVPIVWTLHDCWAFTGKCTYFTEVGCNKWTTNCYQCPQLDSYPKSYGIDNSKLSYLDKKRSFTSIDNIRIVTVSEWLKSVVSDSFFGNKPINTIYNGIDTKIFNPRPSDFKNKYGLEGKFVILGVANVWNERKGLDSFIQLSKLIDQDCLIFLIGLTDSQISNLPYNIKAIKRTTDINEMVEIYSESDVFINFSKEETFGLVVAEAMACGTPAIVYNSTACPEVVNNETGFVAECNNMNQVLKAIDEVREKGKHYYKNACIKRVDDKFSIDKMLNNYISVYEQMLKQNREV